MAFGILIVIGRLEGADGLAHQREIAGQRADGENERLVRIIPWPVRMAVPAEKKRRKPAAAGNRVPALQFSTLPLTGGKINDMSTLKWSLIMAAPPLRQLAPEFREPRAARGSHGGRTARTGRSGCRQKARRLGQDKWRPPGRPGRISPQRMQSFLRTITPPPLRCE